TCAGIGMGGGGWKMARNARTTNGAGGGGCWTIRGGGASNGTGGGTTRGRIAGTNCGKPEPVYTPAWGDGRSAGSARITWRAGSARGASGCGGTAAGADSGGGDRKSTRLN